MPVPKKRVGHSEQAHRRANWKATVPTMSVCPNCGAATLAHTMCGVCGFYKDRVVKERALATAGHDHHDHDHDHEGHDHD
ncbi:MAG: 50S ribosomal protein L32 [Cyanobacteria bacterium]|nr:50S ribosomal protein L32 [Cyanobacteriota bacterium]